MDEYIESLRVSFFKNFIDIKNHLSDSNETTTKKALISTCQQLLLRR